MTRTPREPYCQYPEANEIFERARCLAERDGRLRFVSLGRIGFRPSSYCTCMGAEDWATIEGGVWHRKQYQED